MYKIRNMGMMKCMCCGIVNEIFVKVTSNRTIKAVYCILPKIKYFQYISISNINVIDESLITFDILYFMIVENYKNETCRFQFVA